MKKGDLVWIYKAGPKVSLLLTDLDEFGCGDVLCDSHIVGNVPCYPGEEMLQEKEPAASVAADIRYVHKKILEAVRLPADFIFDEENNDVL